MSCMGLDIGTSGCKAVVFDEDGRQIADAFREYPTLMPEPGWAELDSSRVMDSCLEVVAEAARACPAADPVRTLGVSSQGEAFTAVGDNGEYLSNGMVSFDTRTAALAVDWSREFGREQLYAITGQTAHPMYTLFKLLWIRRNRPEIWAQAARFHCYEDLFHQRLGLEPAISYPLAGRTMLFNVRTHDWDDTILDAVGMDRGRLARPLPSGTVVGKLTGERCRDLGLGADVIVVTAGHDQPCNALGAGVLRAGEAVYGMGTAECICPAFETPVFRDDLFRSNLCTYDFTAKEMYTTVAFSLTGGNLLRWYRDEWAAAEVRAARDRDVDAYEIIMQSLPAEPTDLLVLPYFTPTGTPYFDTATPAAILGLRLGTTRPQVLRGLLEGVAMEMKLNVAILGESGVEIERLTATGGGARSRALIQLKADVLNCPITTVAVTEAGCLGVAMLGWQALTGEDLDSVAARWVRPLAVVEPQPDHAAFYEARFVAYRQLYPVVRDFWQTTQPS